jgi:hypothetical protein
MIIDNPTLFEEAANDLAPHLGHKITVTMRGGDAAPDEVAVECEDCHGCLIDFLPESQRERPDPADVRYQGHYDATRDVCSIEVFKRGKSPYPLQERQDIINHSPTGIAWGYGGSGPAQCAFALLVDYLGDEARARRVYQEFKFRVIAALPTNSEWTLTGVQIEKALAVIDLGRRS